MTDTRRMLLILNGKSAQREDVREAVEEVRGKGHELAVRVTYDAGDAALFAREAVRRGDDGRPEVIVAGGGDGTLNQVVAAALAEEPDTPCAFALLPLGTANDFASGLGLPGESRAALVLAATGRPRPIDVGRINDRLFVNVASGGTVTRITRETDPRAKRLLGGAAYLIAGASRIGELAPTRASFTADGFSWEGEFLAMAIGNGRLAGGGVPLCAEAKVDDGRLDLTLFPQPEADHVLSLLSTLLREPDGRFQGYARRASFTELRVEAEGELALNLDGEPMSASRLDVRVEPGALRFVTGS
jgi:lipid kinase YegS